MNWNYYNFWKCVSRLTIVVTIVFLIVCCGTKKTMVKQTYLKDELNDKKFDSLFVSNMSHSFEKWLHYMKQENVRKIKDSSYVKDSTATRFDAQGNKIGEDRFHYESHERTDKDIQRLLDSISHYEALKDSIDIYRLKIDSLSNIKISNDSSFKVVKEPLTKLQKAFMQIGQISCLCIVVLIIYLLYIAKRKRY